MMNKAVAVSPHSQASEAGAAVLRAGGNCIEAALAIASNLCVVYPHMTGLGGDAFWLIAPNGSTAGAAQASENKTLPLFIDACGPAGSGVSLESLQANGYSKVPTRGPWSGLTMAGAVGGWVKALEISRGWSLTGHVEQSLSSLFENAVTYAHEGFAVTELLHSMLSSNRRVLSTDPSFKKAFYGHDSVPDVGSQLRLPVLGKTLERLCQEGLESFYQGSLAAEMAADLDRLGSPLLASDFAYEATIGEALALSTSVGTLYNSPPPTQGVASLLIAGQLLALYAEGRLDPANEGANIHAIVEATKQAFILRSAHLADPRAMQVDVHQWLTPEHVLSMAQAIDFDQAAPWPVRSGAGDTVWFGVIDRWGNAVSCIQSIYHEFGSGMMLPSSGIIWHNRALGFSLDKNHVNCLAPGKKPFHTLNPALAQLNDGRLLSYGTMGGEGQPQTQAALLFRYLGQQLTPAKAIAAPRWLLGRTWGGATDNLKLEEDCDNRALSYLQKCGHPIELVESKSSLMGHAGLLVRHHNGRLEGGHDPRSDGSVVFV